MNTSPAAGINIWGNGSKSWHTPPPLPLLTLCSWSIHECVNPWDLLEAQLSSTDPRSPADSLFVLQRAILGKQQSWSGHQADTLMTAHFRGAPLSLWEHCMVNTCKHQPNDWISPHPHKYQHSSSSSAEGRKQDSVTETAPHDLPSPYCRSQAHQDTHHAYNNDWTQEKCKNSPSTLLHVLDLQSGKLCSGPWSQITYNYFIL